MSELGVSFLSFSSGTTSTGTNVARTLYLAAETIELIFRVN